LTRWRQETNLDDVHLYWIGHLKGQNVDIVVSRVTVPEELRSLLREA